MANPEHLEILKQGVEVWNRWREDNWYKIMRPDLTEVELSGMDLSGINFVETDLSKASLWEVTLIEANLVRATLWETILGRANLTDANLSNANLKGINFGGAILSKANLKEVDMSSVGFHLPNANLIQAQLDGVNFYQARLDKANFSKANLQAANFQKAHLWEANLSEAKLNRADFTDANLSGAYLWKADLSMANLTQVSLQRTNFIETDLNGTNFHLAITMNTSFGDVDLGPAFGLDTVIHRGPSYVDALTLQRSGDKIPEIFLKGIGMADTFIPYITSLTNEALQYHSCFISYSNKDESFAQRLHADLQQQGVRC
jgi:uncharacterized protein YjbI with pentapeptide repeats